MVENLKHPGLKAASDFAATDKKQRPLLECMPLLLCFCANTIQDSVEMVPPKIKIDFLTSINIIKIITIYQSRDLFSM